MASNKTRRKPLLRKVDSMSSSREASEESNAENDVDSLLNSDASDEVLLPSVSASKLGGGAGSGPDSPSALLDSEALGSAASRTQFSSSTSTRTGQPPHPSAAGVGSRHTASAAAPGPRDTTGEESSASTYDGDVSSATAASRRHPPHFNAPTAAPSDAAASHSHSHSQPQGLGERAVQHSQAYYASVPRADKPVPSSSTTISETASPASSCPPSPEFSPPNAMRPQGEEREGSAHAPAPRGLISKIRPEELQKFIKDIISGDIVGPNGQKRQYSINPPPLDRPVRIYADGVYDLFHYAHALQLRQAKLFFPEVHLMVGVCSDELVKSFKASPVLTSAERYESVGNCRWVDEVIEDAPWEVTQDFIDKHNIDYVAHDEEPYVSLTSSDVYAYAKSVGKFLPTRRTSGISTSELLSRIVEGYRGGDYDNKLEKIGRSDIMSRAASDAGSHSRADELSRHGSPVVGTTSLERSFTSLTAGGGSGAVSPTRGGVGHPLEQSQLAP